MQISLELRQYLNENDIDITNATFREFRDGLLDPLDKMTRCDEYVIYRYIYTMVWNDDMETDGGEKFMQFLLTKNSAESTFMMGMIYRIRSSTGDRRVFVAYNMTRALMMFKLSYSMGSIDACYWVAQCYDDISGDVDELQFLKYAHLSADLHKDIRICNILGYRYYRQHDYRKARHYLKLCTDADYGASHTVDRLSWIECDLLREFDIKLNKDDLLLAYELKAKHNKSGLKELRQKIEKEYFEVLDLPKVLSNLIVSYLLY